MVTFLIYPKKMDFSQHSCNSGYFSLITADTSKITEKIVI